SISCATPSMRSAAAPQMMRDASTYIAAAKTRTKSASRPPYHAVMRPRSEVKNGSGAGAAPSDTERVADATDGVDELVIGVDVDLVAQIADVDVDEVRLAEEI